MDSVEGGKLLHSHLQSLKGARDLTHCYISHWPALSAVLKVQDHQSETKVSPMSVQET